MQNEFYVVKMWDDCEDYYFRNKDNAYECLWTLYLRYGLDFDNSEEAVKKDKEAARKSLDVDGCIFNFGEVEVVGFED